MLVNAVLAVAFFTAPSLASTLVLTPSHAFPQPDRLSSGPLLDSRDTTPASKNDTSTPLNHDRSLNHPAWDALTDTHCKQVLYQLRRATNPSGTAVCYNIPTLDADSGEFTVDLRLYKVSAAVGGWRDADVNRLTTSVDFPWAHVETLSVNGHDGGRLDGTTGNVTARDPGDGDGGEKKMLQVYMLKGKIHPDKLSSNLSTSDLQVLLIPKLTITWSASSEKASSSKSQPAELKVHPSTNEAIFLTGVFSTTVILSPAETELPPAVESLQEGKIPGRTMSLFPTGLVVTGAWTLIGMLVVGLTAREKRQFRVAFLRSVERESRLRRRTSRR